MFYMKKKSRTSNEHGYIGKKFAELIRYRKIKLEQVLLIHKNLRLDARPTRINNQQQIFRYNLPDFKICTNFQLTDMSKIGLICYYEFIIRFSKNIIYFLIMLSVLY